jgi:CubicO group peptidase (beta-lactamase class C family)
MQRRLFLFLCLLPPLLAQASQFAPDKVRRIDQAVATQMSRNSVPGVSVAIATGSQLRWAGGYGMADLENFIPVTPLTEIRLGSISKPITAIAIMQLVEQGRIDLDSEIQRYVPSFPKMQWPVTIRELLGHLSGIRHYQGDAELDSTRHYTDRLEPLKIFSADPLLFEPGTKYSYTTYGFNLLGAAVEGASGEKYLDYVQAHIFRAAGMDHIRDDNVYALIPHRARGYRLTANGDIENCALADTSNKIPGGGFISTASDLVKFMLAVNAGKLVRKETAELMATAQHTRDGKATVYGMGFFVDEFQGRKRFGHTGGQQGITTNVVLYPNKGAAVAIMFNLERARGLRELTDEISKVVLEK